jgi:serine/threonine protein kinase
MLFSEQLVQYSELEAAQLCKQMLQAVFCCHKNGIVHRDIKPASMFPAFID